jgi:hypothetical protein
MAKDMETENCYRKQKTISKLPSEDFPDPQVSIGTYSSCRCHLHRVRVLPLVRSASLPYWGASFSYPELIIWILILPACQMAM